MKQSKKNTSALTAKEHEKENQIKELVLTLENRGFTVRREKLKQGPGWKTVSGTCQLQSDRLIFVDRKNSLDEQLCFLQGVARSLESQSC